MVDSTALEMRHTGNRIGGSNPSLSATFDPGGRARALLTITQALAMAKEGSGSPADISNALELVDFGDS